MIVNRQLGCGGATLRYRPGKRCGMIEVVCLPELNVTDRYSDVSYAAARVNFVGGVKVSEEPYLPRQRHHCV